MDQLACLKVAIKEEIIFMAMLDSLPPSFQYLITTLGTLNLADLTIEFVVSRFMHEVSKKKGKGAESGEAALVEA